MLENCTRGPEHICVNTFVSCRHVQILFHEIFSSHHLASVSLSQLFHYVLVLYTSSYHWLELCVLPHCLCVYFSY